MPSCFFVWGEDLLFVVTALGVDFPGVEFEATEEALTIFY